MTPTRRRYDTDLSDAEGAFLAPLLPRKPWAGSHNRCGSCSRIMPGRAKPCSGASPLAGVGMLISLPKKRGLCSRRFWNRPKPEECWWWLPSKRRMRKPSGVPFIPRWCTARSIAKDGARSYRAPGTRRPAKKSARRWKKVTANRSGANSGAGRCHGLAPARAPAVRGRGPLRADQ
jgi:hypothetical protein